jgi:uncharacterized protein YbjQ (UPF0145 family)
MPDESPLPEFHLPDWGTDGAPPEPTVGDDDTVPPVTTAKSEEIEISVERSMLLTAGPLPLRWQVETIHGVVVGHGKSDKSDLASAVEAATSKALQALEKAAEDRNATAVTDVELVTSLHKGTVVVTAIGTAVEFSR